VASSTFSQYKKNNAPINRVSPQRLALSGEYVKPPTHEWEILVKDKQPVLPETPSIDSTLEKTEKEKEKEKKKKISKKVSK